MVGLQSELDGALHTDAYTPASAEIMHSAVEELRDEDERSTDNEVVPAVIDITDDVEVDVRVDSDGDRVEDTHINNRTPVDKSLHSIIKGTTSKSRKNSKLLKQLESCIGSKVSSETPADTANASKPPSIYGGGLGNLCVPSSPKDDEDWDAESRDLFQLSNMKQRLAIHADEMFLSVRKEHQEEINTLLTHLNKEKLKRKDAVAVAETLISENRSLRETHQLEMLRITQTYEEKFQTDVDERVAKQMKYMIENQKTAHHELECLLNRERRENSRQAEAISKLQSSKVNDVAVAISNTQNAMEKDAQKHIDEIKRVCTMEVEAMRGQCDILQAQLEEQNKHHQNDMETLRFNSEVISQQWTTQAAEAIKEQDSHIERVHELVNETVEQLHTIETEAIQQRDTTIDGLVKQVRSESSFANMVKHLILALFVAVAVGMYVQNASQLVKCEQKDQALYQCQAQALTHNETLRYLHQHCDAESKNYEDRLATTQQNVTMLLMQKDMQCDERLQQVAPHEKQLITMTSNYKRTLSSLSKKCGMWSTHATDELRSSAAAAAATGGTSVWSLLGFPGGPASCDHSMCSRLLRGGHTICAELYEQHVALAE